MRENKTCPNTGWQQMPTEELDQILQAELEKEHPNEEVVLPILHELEEREKDIPVENTPEVLEVLEKLSKHNTSSKQSIHKRRWIAGIAATAAVVCIVIMSMTPTARAESLFDILFRWTSSVFEFFTPEQDASNPPVEIVFETDNPGLQQLYDKASELGVSDPVVPMWLPEGCELISLKDMPVSTGIKINAVFGTADSVISLTYRISSETDNTFEKEDSAVEIYDYADVSHFIMVNDDNISVKWVVDGVSCSIVTDIQKENIYKIIKSIYRRSL